MGTDIESVTLARVIEQCYWMCRYLERSEHIARGHLAALEYSLDRPESYCTASQSQIQQETEELTSSLIHVRENANAIRNILPLDSWLIVNELYLWLSSGVLALIPSLSGAHWFPESCYNRIVRECHCLKGYFQNDLIQDGYFQAMQLGVWMERAYQVTAFLSELAAIEEEQNDLLAMMLRKVASEEPFLKTAQDICKENVQIFMLFCQHSPYSLFFCLQRIKTSLVHNEDASLKNTLPLISQAFTRLPHIISNRDIMPLFSTLNAIDESLHDSFKEIK